MKKFLAFLFAGLIFSVAAQAMTIGMKTDLSPGIECVQGQIEAPFYEVVSASPAAVYVQDTPVAIITEATAPEALYNTCRKTVMSLIDAASELSLGTSQRDFLQAINKDDTDLYCTCNKRLPPGSLSLERYLKDIRVAKQRAVLNRKFSG
ncbi:MAG: hypothetical protein A3K54_00010 [Omnitrophica WOR_2 bacterium RBG_13_44_8]|nr:MAG: hypothetical protein A3K54_00010 [Omnitrophica WOR_2 bacterium RBG_13_44_8]